MRGLRSICAGLIGLTFAAAVTGCSGPAANRSGETTADLEIEQPWIDPESYYPAPPDAGDGRYQLFDAAKNPEAPALAIVDATIMTAAGNTIERGTIVLRGGAIAYVGAERRVPPDAQIIDGSGRTVTPGLIDSHSHIGVYASPAVDAHQDGNEMTAPVTAQARAAYGYWPQDPTITRARAGGVTTALILPGSANLIGGRGATVVMRPGRTVAEVLFPGAPPTIKMACGENPKRVYGEQGGPQTRMAEYAAFRAALHEAAAYDAKKKAYRDQRRVWLAKKKRADAGEELEHVAAPEPPAVDLGLETLAAVLRGEILVQVHCYRASEMAEMIAIAEEFGISIRSFHHALDAYKIRDLLVEHGAAISTWADWWGFKLEAFDGIPENAALFAEAGGRTVIHSDSALNVQRLNQEAAKALWAGRHAGLDISDDEALRWITANPAWVLGVDEVTGTLEVGKRADVVLWSGHPFSVYSRADLVVQGGQVAYTRDAGLEPTDFELGHSALDADRTGRSQAAGAAAAAPEEAR